MEGADAPHHQLRSALRSLQCLFQRRPAEPAHQRRLGVPYGYDAARRLFALLHASPVRARGAGTFTQFAGTTAVPPGSVTKDSAPIAERANYYDLGVQQKLLDKTLTLGVDSYYEQAQHLIDEGQFGAPIILTPFNYRYGLIGGIEFTANYSINNFSAYFNSSWQAAHGKDVESAQFNFNQAALDYIASNYIHLDHEGRVAASSGVSYCGRATGAARCAVRHRVARRPHACQRQCDSERRSHPELYPDQFRVEPYFRHWRPRSVDGTFRCDQRYNKVYQIRSGSGVGVFAPQFGPRRGFFGGLSWKF